MEFFGRESEQDILKRTLADRGVLLEGTKGVGKTALLRDLEGQHVALEQDAAFRVVFISMEGAGSTLVDFVSRLANGLDLAGLGEHAPWDWLKQVRLSRAVERSTSASVDDNEEAWKEAARSIAAVRGTLPEHQRLVICVDELTSWLDALAEREGPDGVRSVLGNLKRLRDQEAISMVLTGSVALASLAGQLKAAGTLADLRALSLSGLQRVPAVSLCKAMATRYGWTVDAEVSGRIYQLTAGNPRWIQRLLAALGAPKSSNVLDMAGVGRAVEELLGYSYRHHFRDATYDHFRLRYTREGALAMTACRALSVAATALKTDAPIGKHEMLDIFERELSIDRAFAERCLLTLEDSFCLQRDGSTLRFCSPLFRQWCEENSP